MDALRSDQHTPTPQHPAAEAGPADTEQYYRRVIDALGVAVYTTDAEGRLTLYNEAASVLWGVRPRLGDARFCGSWKLHTSDGMPLSHADCPMAVALRDRRPIAGAEAVAERPDGTRVPFAAYPTPLRDASGTMVGAMVGAINVLVDITARKTAEASLHRSDQQRKELNALVQTEVQARETAQLQLAHAQRTEALGRLAGGIAHDFNNVLQGLQGALVLIEQHCDDPSAVRRFIQMGLEASRRGSSVTQRLLLFSRRADLRAEAVDLGLLFRDLMELLSHTLGTDIDLHMVVAPDLPRVRADKGQMETVLVNLATNARDAMPKGGKLIFTAVAETIASDKDSERDYAGRLRPGNYMRLEVSDTGTGMDAATLERISEPFFTTKATGKGTGLGIAMARGFAEQSGGLLNLVSAPGCGTTASLWLPVATTETCNTDGGTKTSRAPVPPIKDRRRLLLVDDDDLIRDTMTEMLEGEGYDLLATASGADALRLLDAGEAVDLLLSDLSMPDMDGLTLIQETKRRRPGTPAILLTGHADDMTAAAADVGAAADFSLLRKPIALNQLTAVIESTLAGAFRRFAVEA